MFLRGEPTAWFERAAQPCMYRWNKLSSSLERNFESFGVDLERQMVKEFGNSMDDSSEGGLSRYENAGPSNAPGRDVGGDSSDDGDDAKDTEEQIDGNETLEKGVVRKG